MKNFTKFGLIAILSLISQVSAAPGWAQQIASSYEVQAIEPLSGFVSTGIRALNDNGDAIITHSTTGEIDNGDAIPHLYVDGVSTALSAPSSPGYASASFLNSSLVSAGTAYDGSQTRYATWVETAGPDLISEPASFDQYYLRGLNDSGILVGWGSFDGDIDKGFTYNTSTTALTFDDNFAFLSNNNAGSVLRQAIASFSPSSGNGIELVRTGGTSSITAPTGYEINKEQIGLANNDTVYGAAATIVGSIQKCVLWKSPDWQPIVFTVPNTTGSCEVVSMNASGLMLIGIDLNGTPVYYLSDGTYFWALTELAPDLLNYVRFYAYKVNAQGQVSVQAVSSSSPFRQRALILTGSPPATPTPTPTATPLPNDQLREALSDAKDTLGAFKVNSNSETKAAFKAQMQTLSALVQAVKSLVNLKKGFKIKDLTTRFKDFKVTVNQVLKQKAATFKADKKAAQTSRKNLASILRN